MKSLACRSLPLLLVLSCGAPGVQPIEAPALTEVSYLSGQVQVGERTFPYLLLPPAEIVEGERYPLVLFLHGAGERGSDNQRQKVHFPDRMASSSYSKRYPCFVLAPQCPEDTGWANFGRNAIDTMPHPSDALSAAMRATAEVVRSHPIDTDRIILTGLSMGGYGTFDLAARHPDWFSAAAAICGGGDRRKAALYAGLPLHIWHGGEDLVVPAERSQVMAAALRALRLDVHYTELPGVGHNSWEAAYGDGGCLDALFAAKRNPRMSQEETARLLANAIAPDERIAFLGDSITQAGDQPGGYVDLLRTAIAQVHPGATVIPAGISGNKVTHLLGRYQRDVIDKQATLVFLYIGINDVWHTTSGRGTPAGAYEAGLTTLVRALHASGAAVVLATPSVIGEHPHGTNDLDQLLTQFAAISRTVAAAEGATLCDLQAAFQDHLRIFNPEDKDKGILTRDGVHLNPAGNLLLATQAARALREAVLSRENS